MIIVTGANGFIGSAMVWELFKAGQREVVAVDSLGLDQHNLLQKNKPIQFLYKDQIWDFLKTNQKSIKWVVHMGACSSTTETNWDFLLENNVQYSEKLFSWCTQYQVPIIYASSAATYGGGEHGFSDMENAKKFTPLNLYGRSKLDMDLWVEQQKNKPPKWFGLKFFNVYGPHEYFKGPMASVAFKAFKQIKESGKLKLFKSHHSDYKDGEQLRDFVYVKDVTRWMLELMQKCPPSGIYNMGFGKAETWLSMASSIFLAMGKKMEIEWIEIPAEIRTQYQYFTEADMSKWKNSGMSSPHWSLQQGITDYLKNYLMNGESLL